MYRYSPYPIEEYRLQGLDGQCEAGAIGKLKEQQAVWNMFWLSMPSLDNLPGAGAKWQMKYCPAEGVAAAITVDVTLDRLLPQKVILHPRAFAEWFGSIDASDYGAYAILGGEQWVSTVIARARQAEPYLIPR